MNKYFRKIEYLVLAAVMFVFVIVAGKYFYTQIIPALSAGFDYVRDYVRESSTECPDDKVRITIPGGVLCRDQAQPSTWLNIYDTYPKSGKGKEIIYSFLDRGNLEAADMYLNDLYYTKRFGPVKIEPPITWQEDPYNEKYWRFDFYGLRETRNLLYAGRKTGKQIYFDKLIEIVESFIDNGMDKDHSWDDNHAVAFRTMVLTNTWWKLREQNALSIETSTKMLKALKIHGDFLDDPQHYEAGHNHGINQATALLNLATNFPDLPGADQWRNIAIERFDKGVDDLIDKDGALVENSPYYHFYVLQKYWEIYKHELEHPTGIDIKFYDKIEKMISYGTYILQPNLEVPLVGASLKNRINLAGDFEDMAETNPYFMYVLSQGKQGQQPPQKNVYYSDTGQVIMRSGWDRGNNFEQQTHVVFDVGAYRTLHSDYDAFSFDLYSNGQYLINDPGLFTYEQGTLKDFFDSTMTHNTVMVDNMNQGPGAPVVVEFIEDEDYVYTTAKHDLYPKVVHYRTMMLIDHDLILIIDYLISENEHDYKQMFHLSPGVRLSVDNLTVKALGTTDSQSITIHQLLQQDIGLNYTQGQSSPMNGWCSNEYEVKVPCYAVSYMKTGKVASYVTLLEIGEVEHLKTEISSDQSILKIDTRQKEYIIDINLPVDLEIGSSEIERIEYQKKVVNQVDLQLVLDNDEWKIKTKQSVFKNSGEPDYRLFKTSQSRLGIENSSEIAKEYEVKIKGLDTYFPIAQKVYTHIPIDPKELEFRVYEQEDFVPIFGYHSILSDNESVNHPESEIKKSDFVKQVKYATNVMGCRWYTFGEIMQDYILQNKKTPRRACVMNLDDGYRNSYDNAYPVLQENNIKATFFVIPGRLEASRYMTWQQINELYRQGHEIGSHTVNSGGLVSAGWDQEELVYQITESKKIMDERGYNTQTFAYPLGEYNEEIVQTVKDSGYIAARDISKHSSWRDRRPLTTSLDDDFVWHMYYHKPEKETTQELAAKIGYNTWWQFEEDYNIVSDIDTDIRTRSSISPTETSYATVVLPDGGDAIINSFIISKDGDFNIHFYTALDEPNDDDYNKQSTNIRVSIDNIKQNVTKGNQQACVKSDGWLFCDYTTKTHLSGGKHTILIGSIKNRIVVDKFNIYQTLVRQDAYDMVITEYNYSEIDNHKDNQENQKIIVGISVKNKNTWKNLLLVLGSLVIIILLYQIFKIKLGEIWIQRKQSKIINLGGSRQLFNIALPKAYIAGSVAALIVCILLGSKIYKTNSLKTNLSDINEYFADIDSGESFVDNFEAGMALEENGLIEKSTSANWWLNSGAMLIVNNGVAQTLKGELPKLSKWRMAYVDYNAESTDDGYHPQNIFRLITRNKWRDSQQEVYFRIIENNLSSAAYRNQSNGVLLLSRYLDADNLYYAGIRVDGTTIIKKKIDGEYYTMAQGDFFKGQEYNKNTNPNLMPKDKWLGIRSEVVNQNDGTTTIKLWVDQNKNDNWNLQLEAKDDGVSYGGPAILDRGHAGIRTDFMDVEFDDYRISPY